MFCGIVETTSVVKALAKKQNLFVLAVAKPKMFNDIRIGDSIATDGVCLTVTSLKEGCFTFDLMKETLEATSLKHLVPGKAVNLERAMKAEARVGGHFVTGHVDAVGKITDIRTLPNYVEYRITIPRTLMRLPTSIGTPGLVRRQSDTTIRIAPSIVSGGFMITAVARSRISECITLISSNGRSVPKRPQRSLPWDSRPPA